MAKVNNRRRPHKAPATQRASWIRFRNSPMRSTQSARVIEYLTTKAANSRELALWLKIERASVTRTLKDLEDSNKIEIAFLAKCPITGLMTQFYGVKRSDKVKRPRWLQSDLLVLLDAFLRSL